MPQWGRSVADGACAPKAEYAPSFCPWGNAAPASSLLNKANAHRITEELVSIEKRTPNHWSDRMSMTAVLFLSLGLWAVIWGAIASLASAVFR